MLAAVIAVGMVCTYTVPAVSHLFPAHQVDATVMELAPRVDAAPGAWVQFVSRKGHQVQWLVSLADLHDCMAAP